MVSNNRKDSNAFVTNFMCATRCINADPHLEPMGDLSNLVETEWSLGMAIAGKYALFSETRRCGGMPRTICG